MITRYRRAALIALSAALLNGCVAVQFDDPSQVDAATSAALEKQVPTYTDAQLDQNANYIHAGSVDAFLCRQGLIGTLTDAKVITVLRQKARAIGANGLADVSCEPGPIDEMHGCVASIACQATMLKLVPPDTADK